MGFDRMPSFGAQTVSFDVRGLALFIGTTASLKLTNWSRAHGAISLRECRKSW